MATLPGWCATFVGLPYEPGGRSRAGVDCWGLAALVWAEHFRHQLPNYDGAPWRAGASAEAIGLEAIAYTAAFQPVPTDALREGDGLLFRVRGFPTHVGVYVAPGWMLHAAQGADSCAERFQGPLWGRRLIGAYRPL